MLDRARARSRDRRAPAPPEDLIGRQLVGQRDDASRVERAEWARSIGERVTQRCLSGGQRSRCVVIGWELGA